MTAGPDIREAARDLADGIGSALDVGGTSGPSVAGLRLGAYRLPQPLPPRRPRNPASGLWARLRCFFVRT